MKKIIQRLITFLVGVPLVVGVIFFLPQKNHLVFNIAVLVFCLLAAVEFRNILAQKNLELRLCEALFLGGAGPLAWTLAVSFGLSPMVIPGAITLGALWILISHALGGPDKLEKYLHRCTAGFAVLIYPGLFMGWIIQMMKLPQGGMVVIFYLLTVFLNDSNAWLSGILFGKNSRGRVAASPVKSLAGFIGGIFASVVVAFGGIYIFPEIFTSSFLPAPLSALILGLASGAAVILGDLSESALKRSAGVKDSGTLVMGRGGALDSIDSAALCAPVYYFLYLLLF
ncbi:MAG: phosphatidate cytidylyltransferase [Treponema sp.]|nr:phosphatidate cytidylyltransferase [Treponema sp.]